MTNKSAIIFSDKSDIDTQYGLCFLWEALTNRGYQSWYHGEDIYNLGFDVEPTDIFLINATLPMDVLAALKFKGFNITYIGNKFSPTVTFANSLYFDVTIIDANSSLSAIIYAYYVYMQHSLMGNRLDFLPSKIVSEDLNFIYNNKMHDLITVSLTNGTYVAGINGPILKQNIGNAVVYTKSLDWRLNNYVNSKGILYV